MCCKRYIIAYLNNHKFTGESFSLPCCLTGFTHEDCDAIDVASNDLIYSNARVTVRFLKEINAFWR